MIDVAASDQNSGQSWNQGVKVAVALSWQIEGSEDEDNGDFMMIMIGNWWFGDDDDDDDHNWHNSPEPRWLNIWIYYFFPIKLVMLDIVGGATIPPHPLTQS